MQPEPSNDGPTFGLADRAHRQREARVHWRMEAWNHFPRVVHVYSALGTVVEKTTGQTVLYPTLSPKRDTDMPRSAKNATVELPVEMYRNLREEAARQHRPITQVVQDHISTSQGMRLRRKPYVVELSARVYERLSNEARNQATTVTDVVYEHNCIWQD